MVKVHFNRVVRVFDPKAPPFRAFGQTNDTPKSMEYLILNILELQSYNVARCGTNNHVATKGYLTNVPFLGVS